MIDDKRGILSLSGQFQDQSANFNGISLCEILTNQRHNGFIHSLLKKLDWPHCWLEPFDSGSERAKWEPTYEFVRCLAKETLKTSPNIMLILPFYGLCKYFLRDAIGYREWLVKYLAFCKGRFTRKFQVIRAHGSGFTAPITVDFRGKSLPFTLWKQQNKQR